MYIKSDSLLTLATKENKEEVDKMPLELEAQPSVPMPLTSMMIIS